MSSIASPMLNSFKCLHREDCIDIRSINDMNSHNKEELCQQLEYENE